MSPSVRELLEASDNPALPPYLAGIEAAMALQNAIGDAHLLGLEYALACKATARGFADQMPADLLTDCGDCLQKQAAPFWGHDGIPALDKVDAQMLAAWLAEQGGEHE
ncbi:hypothetical protein SAMN05660284_00259 [Formivibrio citricus]|uniref:Uncharacterized protein n=2 Tax=Formivibrio citricus TaxID=83765 RepID=A0A1I4VKU0_9NEIS|nr:hypothetical protein SAMN05660284_00259 [Formivibrio citricus]